MSVCEEGRFFKDVLAEDYQKHLGVAKDSSVIKEMSILVKLLDSAERLVIQCHPTIEFAKSVFDSNFGKTECWYMLDTEEDAYIYLGFKQGITKEKWIKLYQEQNIDGMLDCLNRFSVKKGGTMVCRRRCATCDRFGLLYDRTSRAKRFNGYTRAQNTVRSCFG